MISLIDILPNVTKANAEYIKIKCLYDSYKEDKDTLFWSQDGGRAYISLSFGDMVIKNNCADTEELKEFISIISPNSIFTDIETFRALNIEPDEIVNVIVRNADIGGETEGDRLSSKELYEILNVSEFSLPLYPHFAVDFCRRLNKGYADYFAVKDKCAAVTFCSGEFALLNGIVSREKGMGSVCLMAVLQKNYGRQVVAVCRDELMGFYEKNGFKKLYKAGYKCLK